MFLEAGPIMLSTQYSWTKQQQSMATKGLDCWGEQEPGLICGFTLCTDFWAKEGHWKLQFTPQPFQVLLTIPELLCPSKILKIKISVRQFTVHWELFSPLWKLYGNVMLTTMQWTKVSISPMELMMQCWIQPWILMMLTCLDQCKSLKWLELTWKWPKFLEKSRSLKCTIINIFIFISIYLV